MSQIAAINLDIAAYREPVDVEFQNLCYSVKSRKGFSTRVVGDGCSWACLSINSVKTIMIIAVRNIL